MKVAGDPPLHLTYCTNIHPADGWPGVSANLRTYAPALKQRFSPDAPFGLGLRLSARDARELLDGHLDDFASWLAGEGLYVAILNGFPHGQFHRTPVKEEVYAPDWRDPERLRYTRDLIRIVARLVPAGLDAGVSTAPLSYKTWMARATGDEWMTIVRHLVEIAADLVKVRERDGTLVHLDIEPEPDCVLETSAETITFFEQRLLPHGAPLLARTLGISEDRARAALLEHISVCFDCCHFAVEHEDAHEALTSLQRAGLRIGRVQLSSALDVHVPASPDARARVLDRLRTFADSTYLHQTVEADAGELRHYPDLGPAIEAAVNRSGAGAFRTHFHVPLYAASYEELGSTQDYVRTVIHAARAQGFTRHLEIETYTWDVLPAALKTDLGESIAREYEWTLRELRSSKPEARSKLQPEF